MNIFGIGLPEMGLIMVIALLVFWSKKVTRNWSEYGQGNSRFSRRLQGV